MNKQQLFSRFIARIGARLVPLVFAGLPLASCTSLNIGSSPEQKFERAVEEHRYVAALAIAEREIQKRSKALADESASDQKILESTVAENSDPKSSAVSNGDLQAEAIPPMDIWVRNLHVAWDDALKFQSMELEQIDALVQQKHWLKIDEQLSQLKTNVPENPALTKMVAQVDLLRNQDAEYGRRQLLEHEAGSLPVLLALYDQLHAADPKNRRVNYWRKQLKVRQEQLIDQLRDEFVAATDEGSDLQYALTVGRHLNSLAPDDQLALEIEQLEQALAEVMEAANRRAESQREALRLTNEKVMLERYQQALEDEQWLELKLMISEILRHYPESKDWQARSNDLQVKIDQVVDQERRAGEQFYAEGNIEEALMRWQQVLPLAPDNEKLKANIERASRILDKIDLLKASEVAADQ